MVLLGPHHTPLSNFVLPSFISFTFVLLSQFALAMVPCYFSFFPFLAKLALSALLLLAVTGFGGCCRRLVRVHASAPAFVFFNVLFIWGVYVAVIREAIPSLSDVVFNLELSLLMIGYYRILCSDPGLVTHQSSGLDKIIGNRDSEEEELSPSHVIHEQHSKEAEETGYPLTRRVRYCKHCKAYIWGFDHHCPAFGNCIGQKNHALFMALLVGFIIAEASYVMLSTQFITVSRSIGETVLESNPASNLATSTMLFCLIQVLWQVVFLTWHIYCICFNIKTDEWINWRKYPEFQLTVQCQPGHTLVETKFRNPYDTGILSNVKEFLAASKSQFWCTC
ncbi:palmitoyltransferase ZDHHC12-like [Telopea speciosissima]|uniref:palmitoyltransferase ZDHHC12-like n=1 Tax=Telopea speciosissima TaxID=54955 RepID=UPI001CC82E2A|nr:palmitoyltransferase ZDHHC12-like [Telopea speciosissima]